MQRYLALLEYYQDTLGLIDNMHFLISFLELFHYQDKLAKDLLCGIWQEKSVCKGNIALEIKNTVHSLLKQVIGPQEFSSINHVF